MINHQIVCQEIYGVPIEDNALFFDKLSLFRDVVGHRVMNDDKAPLSQGCS